MSGCGKPNCSNGSDCQCASGCSCCRTMVEPTFGRNYRMEGDCTCGPNCNCADCGCHK